MKKFSLLALLIMTGCGGGGGSSNNEPLPPPPTDAVVEISNSTCLLKSHKVNKGEWYFCGTNSAASDLMAIDVSESFVDKKACESRREKGSGVYKKVNPSCVEGTKEVVPEEIPYISTELCLSKASSVLNTKQYYCYSDESNSDVDKVKVGLADTQSLCLTFLEEKQAKFKSKGCASGKMKPEPEIDPDLDGVEQEIIDMANQLMNYYKIPVKDTVSLCTSDFYTCEADAADFPIFVYKQVGENPSESITYKFYPTTHKVDAEAVTWFGGDDYYGMTNNYGTATLSPKKFYNSTDIGLPTDYSIGSPPMVGSYKVMKLPFGGELPKALYSVAHIEEGSNSKAGLLLEVSANVKDGHGGIKSVLLKHSAFFSQDYEDTKLDKNSEEYKRRKTNSDMIDILNKTYCMSGACS